MREMNFLCLASSKKDGGRCVAGIDLDTGQWVRPVTVPDSGLEPPTILVGTPRRSIRPLDQVIIAVGRNVPAPEQPENIEILPSAWTLVKEWSREQVEPQLERLASNASTIFDTLGPSVPCASIPSHGVRSSLEIRKVSSPRFDFENDRYGRPKLRAHIHTRGSNYNLPVTDLEAWSSDLNERGLEKTLHGDWYFTISLGMRWNDKCWKLVAAGFEPLPPQAPVDERFTGADAETQSKLFELVRLHGPINGLELYKLFYAERSVTRSQAKTLNPILHAMVQKQIINQVEPPGGGMMNKTFHL